MIHSPLPTSDAMPSASGQGEVLKKRSVNLFQLSRNKIGKVRYSSLTHSSNVSVTAGNNIPVGRGLYTES